MTDQQRLLMPYVENRVDTILAELKENLKRPLVATKVEIMTPIHEDVLACMRELHHSGKYRGTNTLNNPALIKEND